MKNSFLFILIVCLPTILCSQIPNSGFESWTNIGSYSNPDGWGTLNDLTASTGLFTCTKGTPGNPGSSYIKLTSRSVTGMGIKPGIAVSGVLNTTTMTAKSGFPCTVRPQSLKGNWQYMAYGSDRGYISVFLSKWNNATHHRDTIAMAYYALPGMVMSWAAFTIPLSYKSGAYPDSAIIIASSSNANGAVTAVNSYVYLDNLTFYGTVTGIDYLVSAGNLSICPNPATANIIIKIPEKFNQEVNAVVYDLAGHEVISSNFHGVENSVSMDISSLPAAIYFINVISGGKIYSGKFIRKPD